MINMKIPKIVRKNGRKYKLLKIYETYVLYEDIETKVKECFNKQELGLVKEKEKPWNLSPEKVKR